jgi:hypothetical protein
VPQFAQEELDDPDVELVAAQARANVAIVEAIGTQIQVALETPGIKSFLEDAAGLLSRARRRSDWQSSILSCGS